MIKVDKVPQMAVDKVPDDNYNQQMISRMRDQQLSDNLPNAAKSSHIDLQLTKWQMLIVISNAC